MIYPSIDKLLTIVDSKFELVHIAARRATEMEQTEIFQMKENEYVSYKGIGRALEELCKGLIIVEK